MISEKFSRLDAFQQFFDSQIFRSDVIERRDPATVEHDSARETRLFSRAAEYRLVVHHAEQIARARFVAANLTKLICGEKAAKLAGADLGARFRNRGHDLFRLIIARLNHPQRDRSAERGPTPGICRICVIKSRIASGYSVLLKT